MRTATLLFLFSIISAPLAAKPNIVFFFVDDMGWTDLGYMGSKYYESPHVDKLASEPPSAGGGLTICKIDIDAGNNDALAEEFQVGSVPTFVYLKGGKEVERSMGADIRRVVDCVQRLK